MNEVLILQHVPHETLGTLEAHFSRAGVACRYVELFREVPTRLPWDRAMGLVVLGGPMNVDHVEQYPFLGSEVGWLQEAVGRQLPVLGICLGAQLLAKSLGAKVFANPVKEIGWYEIELLPAAAGDPLLHGCQPRQTVFQWHGDTFDLPPGAVQLARSGSCENQAFRYGPSAYGLQFHVEVTESMVNEWLDQPANSGELASLPDVDPGRIRAESPRFVPPMERFGGQILPRFAALCLRGA